MSIFDVFGDSLDLNSRSSHPDIMGTVPEESEEMGYTGNTCTHPYESEELSLDGALLAESQQQPDEHITEKPCT